MNSDSGYRFFKALVKSQYGKGFWIAETDEEGWAIRQLEVYPGKKVITNPAEMVLAGARIPQGLKARNVPFEELTKEDFEKYFNLEK